MGIDQCLKQAQELMTMSVSVIAYLRGLFPERAFASDQSTGLELKKFVRGKSTKIDKLLNLLEKGCVDAMRRKIFKNVDFINLHGQNEPIRGH